MDKTLLENLFQALMIHAGNEGRAAALFGSSYERAREAANPFLVGKEMPAVYLEFPLIGEPFLDLTFLYADLAPNTRVDHPSVAGTEAIFDWCANAWDADGNVSFGFELDTHKPEIPTAAIHFQPRTHTELVQAFCDVAAAPEKGALYLEMTKRMPKEWPLSFFGMFRGRPESPLRICGYLDTYERNACAQSVLRIQQVFDQVGFSAYDTNMLEQVAGLFAIIPGQTDFQFDVYPDGTLGDTFAIDVNFEIQQPEQVFESFENGLASHVMRQFQAWGIADDRVKLAPELTFARGLPIPSDDGNASKVLLTLFPVWAKARWRAGVLQPAKLYAYAKVSIE